MAAYIFIIYLNKAFFKGTRHWKADSLSCKRRQDGGIVNDDTRMRRNMCAENSSVYRWHQTFRQS